MLDDVYHGYLDWNMMFAAERLGRLDAQKTGIAAYLARDSYYNDPRYAETLLTLGFFDVQSFYHNHLQALIGCRDIQTPEGAKALVVIVFRGSDQVQDWLQNLDIRMTRFLNKEKFPHLSRLKVHNGIFERVHDFEDWSRRVIFKDGPLKGNLLQMLGDELKRKKCFFWIIGHSLDDHGNAYMPRDYATVTMFPGTEFFPIHLALRPLATGILRHAMDMNLVFGPKKSKGRAILSRYSVLSIPKIPYRHRDLPMSELRRLKADRLHNRRIDCWGLNMSARK